MTQKNKASFKERIRTLSRYGLAFFSLGFGTMAVNEMSPDIRFQMEEHTDKYDSLVDRKHCKDKTDVKDLLDIIHMASETKSGAKLLDFFLSHGGQIYSANLEKGITGENLGMAVRIDSEYLHKAARLKVLSTLLHECEHARHNQIAHQNSIYNDSFDSYEDRYIYTVLKESLAERAGQLGVSEYKQKYTKLLFDKAPRNAQEEAENAFYRRFLCMDDNVDNSGYEIDALVGNNHAKPDKNTRIFLQPNWGALASLLSGGEIQQIDQLPLRSFNILNMTLKDYLQKNPNISSIKQMKLETFKLNKDKMLEDSMSFKCSVLSWLPQDMQEKFLQMDWREISNLDFLKKVQHDLKDTTGKNAKGTDSILSQKALDFYEQLFFPKSQNALTLHKGNTRHNTIDGQNI